MAVGVVVDAGFEESAVKAQTAPPLIDPAQVEPAAKARAQEMLKRGRGEPS